MEKERENKILIFDKYINKDDMKENNNGIKKYRKTVIDYILEDMKNEKASQIMKELLYEIVNNFEERTQKQKKRFLLYYNSMPEQKKNYDYKTLAIEENCTIPAVKNSISRVRGTLYNSYLSKKIENISELINEWKQQEYFF